MDFNKNKGIIIGGGLALAAAAIYFMSGSSTNQKQRPSNIPDPKSNGGNTTGQIVKAASTAGTVAEQVAQLVKQAMGGNKGGSPQTGATPKGGGGLTGDGIVFSKEPGGKNGKGVKKGNNPNQSDLATAGISEDNAGNVKDATGKKLGDRDTTGGITYSDGSYHYPEGATWHPDKGILTYDNGEITDKYGNSVGSYDDQGNILAYENAMFDANGGFVGYDWGDGSYSDAEGTIYDYTTGDLVGYENGNDTWTDPDGYVFDDQNNEIGEDLGDGYYYNYDGSVYDSYSDTYMTPDDYYAETGDDYVYTLDDYYSGGRSAA